MKYKTLLIGNSQSLFDDFFTRTSGNLEYQTCSLRYVDITSHLKYFKPQIIVFCTKKDSEKEIMIFDTLKRQILSERIAFIVLGNLDDCFTFTSLIPDLADATLSRPISLSLIEEQLIHSAENKRILKDAFSKPEQDDSSEDLELPSSVPGRKHILVVDDDARMLKLIKTYLIDQYDVATAINGKVALKFLENRKTDLILLDYEMPEESGAQVLEKLRFNPQTSTLPVIFLTGVSDREAIQKVLSLNPQGYLLKPVSRVKLHSCIKNVLG